MNRALMAKLGWHLLNRKDALWSRMLKVKYGCGREGKEVFKTK